MRQNQFQSNEKYTEWEGFIINQGTLDTEIKVDVLVSIECVGWCVCQVKYVCTRIMCCDLAESVGSVEH